MRRGRVFARVALVALVALVACGSGDRAPPPSPPPPPAPRPTPPGLRLPAGVTPRAYDVRLEIDPAQTTFHGRVAITTTLAARTDVIWLHAVGLDLTSTTFRDGAYTGHLTTTPGTEDMIGLRLDRPAGPGELVLDLAYTGKIGGKEEGLFREQSDQRWFVYSQSESVFARRFVPCFDEPRFKPVWRTTLVVPRDDVALANAPVAREQQLPDGRREVAFAEIGPMPSYLLAVAVGPFALVDLGEVGRARIHARIAVPPEDAPHLAIARSALPEVVAALERYMDRPLPWPKLDVVGVPWFFGGMENVGLVMVSRPFLVEGGRRGGRGDLIKLVAHELAHQWFGNTVTHAWWDELWLTESICELVAAHVARELGAPGAAPSAAADDGESPGALRQPIAVTDDIEGTFGATAYARGHRVLAMFERFAGEAAMRDALRAYVSAHAGGSVTVRDLASALAAVSTPALGDALTSVAEHAGTPIVELGLACDAGPPHLVAHVRDGVSLPLCVRYEGAPRPACALVGDRTDVPLAGATCPAWLVGNADGAGLYRVVSADDATAERTTRAIPAATGSELHALATDAIAVLDASPPRIGSAARLASALARDRRPAATLAMLAIVRALDPLVADDDRAAWTAWLAQQLRAPLADPRWLVARDPAIRDAMVALVPDRVAAPIARRARAQVDRAFGPRGAPVAWAQLDAAFALAARDPALFDRALAFARDTRSAVLVATGQQGRADALLARDAAAWTDIAPSLRDARRLMLADGVLAHLDAFGPALAPRLVDAAVDPRLPAPALARSVAGLLARPAAASSAWRALAPRLPAVVARLDPAVAGELLDATGALCDATARAQVDAAFAPLLAHVADGPTALARALASIDRCIARRAAAGSVARALP